MEVVETLLEMSIDVIFEIILEMCGMVSEMCGKRRNEWNEERVAR